MCGGETSRQETFAKVLVERKADRKYFMNRVLPTSLKVAVLILSAFLSVFLAETVFPTPNAIHGGEVKMILIIFFIFGFKAVIEFILRQWISRRAEKSQAKSSQPILPP